MRKIFVGLSLVFWIILLATAPSAFSADAILSWDANLEPDAAGYRVYYGTAPGVYLQVKGQGLDAGNALSYTAANLAEGNTYYSALTAYDQAGNESDYSLEVSKNIPVPDTQSPKTPAGLTAQAVSSAQIDLSWTASTDNVGVAGYKIYRDGILRGTIDEGGGTSYSDTGLTASTAYSYTISAYDSAGNESAQSQAVLVTTLALPNNPPSLEPIASITTNEGEVIAIIPKAADIDGDVLTYSVRGLPQGADYDFNPQTGRLNWRTTYKEAGEYDLNWTVDDGRN